jgi:hypothetical protein
MAIMIAMASESATIQKTTAVRNGRGWGRSLLLAIAVHVVLGVSVWRVGARFGVWTAGNSTAAVMEDSKTQSRIPVIMQAAQAIQAAPGRAPMTAFSDADEQVEWRYKPHDRVGVDWSGQSAPLIGYRASSDDFPAGPTRVQK